MTMKPAGSPAPSSELMRMITGFYVSRAVHLVTELGLPDLLADGSRTGDELARATGTHPRSLSRLLRLLAGAGVLVQDSDDRFSLSPTGDLLRTGVPGSLRDLVTVFAGPDQHRLWGELGHTIRTGEPAFERTMGAPVFEYYPRHPEEAMVFDRAMTYFASQIAAEVVDAYDFPSEGTVVDVGGGQGLLVRGILRTHPGTRGVLYDLPHVVDRVRDEVAASDLADRCQVVAGDIFSEVPAGGDVYLLKSILHDWDDERSHRILRKVHGAMSGDGRLLIIEPVVPDLVSASDHDLMVLGSDLNMMVALGGRERTETQFRELLDGAGFKLNTIVPLGGLSSGVHGVSSIIESVPVR